MLSVAAVAGLFALALAPPLTPQSGPPAVADLQLVGSAGAQGHGDNHAGGHGDNHVNGHGDGHQDGNRDDHQGGNGPPRPDDSAGGQRPTPRPTGAGPAPAATPTPPTEPDVTDHVTSGPATPVPVSQAGPPPAAHSSNAPQLSRIISPAAEPNSAAQAVSVSLPPAEVHIDAPAPAVLPALPSAAGGLGPFEGVGGVPVLLPEPRQRPPASAPTWSPVALLVPLPGLLLLLLAAGWYRSRRRLEAQAALASTLGISRRHLSGLPAADAALLASRVGELNQRIDTLVSEAVTDDLTGVLRRRAGLAALERDLARVGRAASGQLAIVFVDLDGLKGVNDRLGHAQGDHLLRRVARSLETGLRGQDLVFRYGGDEFVCILPDSDAAPAWTKVHEIAIRLAAELGHMPFSHGAAQFMAGDSAVALLARADDDLYQRRRA